jgi:bifunctional non-homologous end joining protein LigD
MASDVGSDSATKARKTPKRSDRKNPEPKQPRSAARLTNPDRVLYPESDITKRDLADYYESIADWILPHIVNRPLSIVRCPEGREGECFFQKHMTGGMPKPLRGIEVEASNGKRLYLAVDDVAGLVSLAQIGALEIHPWAAREDRLDRPDRLILDLDPGAGVDWNELVFAAREVKELLHDVGLTSFLRTTGGKGLHIVLPLVGQASWGELKSVAHGFALALERRSPERYIATASKARREGKIYVDYLRNERGATAIASYSTRARAGAPVATPLWWDELSEKLDPTAFNLHTVPGRLAQLKRDPWDRFLELKQKISNSLIKSIGKR